MTAPVETDYFAFISYSHQDQLWADWLHKALETYRVPRRLVGETTAAGTIPARLVPIFRDREDLASATDLGRTVNAALARSKNLIVICSPHAAASRWVNEEVRAFKHHGGGERIFCLIVGGEPNASALPGREGEECFVAALRHGVDASGALTADRAEPVAADARAGKDGKANAKLKLVAGMLDVGYDVLKQRELHRRNRRLALLAAAALVVMAITTTLAITAVIARHDAERRQKQAEDLVGFMLGDLNDKLNQVNRLDIMEAVDDKAMAYFKSLPASDVTEDALAQRAKALERIGTVRLDQGHLTQALESYEASLELISSLARAAPGDITRQLAYAENVSFIGMAHWYQGNLEAAAADFRSAESIILSAAKINQDHDGVLFQRQIIENNLGHVLESRGQLDEALVVYREALRLAETMTAADPNNTDWSARLGDSHNNIGKIALMRGDLVSAIAEYAADDRIETALSARDPRNNDQRQNVFRVRAILARTLALAGETGAAIRGFREALQIADELARQDGSITSLQENSALYRAQLSRLLRLTDALPEAKKLSADSLQTFASLTAQDPANASWQREFAEVRTEHAAQLAVSGRTEDARSLALQALEALEAALQKQPDDRALLLGTINAQLLLSGLVDESQARTLLEKCVRAANAVRSGPDDPRLLGLKAAALLRLGRKPDAEDVVAKLQKIGYADPAFIDEMKRARIDYSADALVTQQLQAAVQAR